MRIERKNTSQYKKKINAKIKKGYIFKGKEINAMYTQKQKLFKQQKQIKHQVTKIRKNEDLIVDMSSNVGAKLATQNLP